MGLFDWLFGRPRPATSPPAPTAPPLALLRPERAIPDPTPIPVTDLARDGMGFVPHLWAAAVLADGGDIDLKNHQVDILYRGLRIQIILGLLPGIRRLMLGLYEREAQPIPDEVAEELAGAILPSGFEAMAPPPAPREPIPGIPAPGPWMRQYLSPGSNP